MTHSDFQGELGEVILGRVTGRETEDDITIFKSVGTAVLDIVVAQRIYEKALATQVGRKVEM